MTEALKALSPHMREFGLQMLGSAVVGATFSEHINVLRHAASVVQAASAAEVLAKARLAETDVGLIFEPPLTDAELRAIDLDDLLYTRRSIAFSRIPGQLAKLAGYEIDEATFQDFGKLRNRIVHIGVHDRDLSEATLRFAFEVMEPMVNRF